MTPPSKPISLSDIHDIYCGPAKKRDTAGAGSSYRKTDHFTRDAGHSGAATNRPPLPTGRGRR